MCLIGATREGGHDHPVKPGGRLGGARIGTAAGAQNGSTGASPMKKPSIWRMPSRFMFNQSRLLSGFRFCSLTNARSWRDFYCVRVTTLPPTHCMLSDSSFPRARCRSGNLAIVVVDSQC
jgi:hypothetical protein